MALFHDIYNIISFLPIYLRFIVQKYTPIMYNYILCIYYLLSINYIIIKINSIMYNYILYLLLYIIYSDYFSSIEA